MATRRTLLGFSAASLLAISVLSAATVASAADAAGTYRLVSARNFGEAGTGILMLNAKGRFSMILMKGDLPKYASGNRANGSPEEFKATATGSLAYYGTYTVSGTELTFNVEKSTFANQDGTQSKRIDLRITTEGLEFTAPAPTSGGAPDRLVFKRID